MSRLAPWLLAATLIGGTIDMGVELLRPPGPLWRIPVSEGGGRDVAFSPDGRSLALASAGGLAVYDVALRGPRFVVGAGRGSRKAVWARQGGWLASADRDNQVRIYDGRNGRLLRTIGVANGQPGLMITSLALSPGGQLLAVNDGGGAVSLFETTSGIWVGTIQPPRSAVQPAHLGLGFTSRGELAVLCSSRGAKNLLCLYALSPQGAGRQFAIKRLWHRRIADRLWAVGGDRFATAGEGQLTLWRSRGAQKINSQALPNVRALSVSDDGAHLIALTDVGVEVLDADLGVSSGARAAPDAIGAMLSPDGGTLAVLDNTALTLWPAP